MGFIYKTISGLMAAMTLTTGTNHRKRAEAHTPRQRDPAIVKADIEKAAAKRIRRAEKLRKQAEKVGSR